MCRSASAALLAGVKASVVAAWRRPVAGYRWAAAWADAAAPEPLVGRSAVPERLVGRSAMPDLLVGFQQEQVSHLIYLVLNLFIIIHQRFIRPIIFRPRILDHDGNDRDIIIECNFKSAFSEICSEVSALSSAFGIN